MHMRHCTMRSWGLSAAHGHCGLSIENSEFDDAKT